MPVPIAMSLAGLRPEPTAPWGEGARAAIRWAAASGWRAIVLDAAAPETRPRALDGSARRDLASALRRSELAFAGLDLWIPPEHFTRPDTIDRAIATATSAADLVAALHTLVANGDRTLNLTLADNATEARSALWSAAQRAGVHIADCRWPPSTTADQIVGVGLDPAAMLLAGVDPVQASASAASTATGARLNDLSAAGRIVPGASGGRLDVEAYLATLDVAGYRGHAVIDLRGVPDQASAAEDAKQSFAK